MKSDSGAYEIYEVGKWLPDNCVCVRAKYVGAVLESQSDVGYQPSRDIMFFEDGSVVFWNVSSEEQENVLRVVARHEENPYERDMVNGEAEFMHFHQLNSTEDNSNEMAHAGNEEKTTFTRLTDGHIYLASDARLSDQLLDKYALADALSLSVKLGIWEKRLDEFAERIEYIVSDLKSGKKLELKSEQVLMLLGELFTMRHAVNLQSSFLDTPDFYWDRDRLEQLYTRLYTYLMIGKRTRLYNDRLNHCIDLMQILKQQLSDSKHTRLEWIIIALIAIEVSIALGFLDLIKSILGVN